MNLDDVKLSVAIQHHPSRADLVPRLRAALKAPRRGRRAPLIDVVVDPDPDGPRNPWRTAREAWLRTPPDCTHRLVLQDDVLPCTDFLRHATRALATRPDRVTSFYAGTFQSDTHIAIISASARCAAWAVGSRSGWCPALALAVPREWCASLAAFDDGTVPIADDEVYGRWLRSVGLPWFATIPSLVNHDDDAPSLMRHPQSRGRRQAACWVGDVDPGLIDWTID